MEFKELTLGFEKQYLVKYENFYYVKRIITSGPDDVKTMYYRGLPLTEKLNTSYYYDLDNLKMVDPIPDNDNVFLQQYIFAPIIDGYDFYIASYREYPELEVNKYKLKGHVFNSKGKLMLQEYLSDEIQKQTEELLEYLISMDLFEVFKGKPSLLNNKNFIYLDNIVIN